MQHHIGRKSAWRNGGDVGLGRLHNGVFPHGRRMVSGEAAVQRVASDSPVMCCAHTRAFGALRRYTWLRKALRTPARACQWPGT